VPLGFSRSCSLFRHVPRLPENYGTAHLPGETLARPRSPLSARPIDILFQGSLTPRRGEFFSRAGEGFSRYRAYIHFSDPARPVIPGSTTAVDTPTMIGLAQRAKLVLNIHARQARYFEWHRIAVHGVGQGALVVSEPCTPAPPFRPGQDYVEAPLQDIPEAVDYYLSSPQGRREAAAIAARGRRTYMRDCRMKDVLRTALRALEAPAPRADALPARVTYSRSEELPPVRYEVLFSRGDRGPAPRATVGVTLYDYERYIIPCLDSVKAQTLRRLDLVVVDDASTDSSVRAAKRWLERGAGRFSRSLLVRHKANAGVAAARNTAFERSRTPYVFVLDADNLVFPTCMERLAGALDRTYADFAYPLLGRFGEEYSVANARPWRVADFNAGNYIDAMVMLRKSAWEAMGGYRKSNWTQGWEDYDFWLRLARSGGWGIQVPEVLGAYRVHLRSMIHADTNPRIWKLMDYFRSEFHISFSGSEGPPPGLSATVYGAKSLRPPSGNGHGGDGNGRERAALSLLHDSLPGLRRRR
jgi:GT2 family glycosyltransferase